MSTFRAGTTASRIIAIAGSLALSIANVETSLAAGADTARPHGLASTLRLKIPLSGSVHTDSRPTLAFGVGPSWQLEGDTPSLSSYRYAPSLEAGITFGGDPVLRLGSTDLLALQRNARANAAPAEGSQNTVWMWILSGVAVVAVLSAVGANNNGSNIPGCDPTYYTYDPERGTCILDPNKPGAFRSPPQPNPYQ